MEPAGGGARAAMGRADRARGAAVAMRMIDSPLGPLAIGATERGVCLVGFGAREEERPGPAAALAHLDRLEDELAGYFAGERREFGVALDLGGTAFQRAVWSRLLAIPYGATRSYEALAREVGLANGQRAVGAANGANPVAIVVPCHRVIAKDGGLGGYGGGLERKRWLLAHEGAGDFSAEADRARGPERRARSGRLSGPGLFSGIGAAPR